MVSPVLSSTQYGSSSPSSLSIEPCSHEEEETPFEIDLEPETTLEDLASQLKKYLGILGETIEYCSDDLEIDDFIEVYDELKEWVNRPIMIERSVYRTFKYWEARVDELKNIDDSDAADDLPFLYASELRVDFVLSPRMTLEGAKKALNEYRSIVLKKARFSEGVDMDPSISHFCHLLNGWIEKETRRDQTPNDALQFWAKKVERIRASLDEENSLILPEIDFS